MQNNPRKASMTKDRIKCILQEIHFLGKTVYFIYQLAFILPAWTNLCPVWQLNGGRRMKWNDLHLQFTSTHPMVWTEIKAKRASWNKLACWLSDLVIFSKKKLRCFDHHDFRFITVVCVQNSKVITAFASCAFVYL